MVGIVSSAEAFLHSPLYKPPSSLGVLFSSVFLHVWNPTGRYAEPFAVISLNKNESVFGMQAIFSFFEQH